jgi:hypothetical protein
MTVTVSYTGDMKDDIDTAIAAASSGESILVPNGTYNFDGTVTFNGRKIYAQSDYAVTLQQAQPSALATPMFKIDGADGILQGFKLEAYVKPGISDTTIESEDLVNGFKGHGIDCIGATDFKIFDCAVEDFSSMGVWCNNSKGLIKRCYVWAPYKESISGCTWAYGVVIENSGYGDVAYVQDVLGRYDTSTHPVVYVEDCTFSVGVDSVNGRLRHSISQNRQGCFVARYNSFRGAIPTNFQIIDMHNNNGLCECYENTINGLSQLNSSAFSFNDGYQFIHDNYIYNCYQAYTIGAVDLMYYWDNHYSGVTRTYYTTQTPTYLSTRLFNSEYVYLPLVYPHPLSDDATPTEAEVYSWLDTHAALYSGTRTAPYLAAWGFTTSSKRTAFWDGAWNQYGDKIGSTTWFESSTYYITFPKLYLAWNPDYQEPPYEPPPTPDPIPPAPDPTPEPPPVPPPPETDPPPNPPAADEPVVPPTAVPDPIPGMDLPVNPNVGYTHREGKLLSQILASLERMEPKPFSSIARYLGKTKSPKIQEVFDYLEKCGVVG